MYVCLVFNSSSGVSKLWFHRSWKFLSWSSWVQERKGRSSVGGDAVGSVISCLMMSIKSDVKIICMYGSLFSSCFFYLFSWSWLFSSSHRLGGDCFLSLRWTLPLQHFFFVSPLLMALCSSPPLSPSVFIVFIVSHSHQPAVWLFSSLSSDLSSMHPSHAHSRIFSFFRVLSHRFVCCTLHCEMMLGVNVFSHCSQRDKRCLLVRKARGERGWEDKGRGWESLCEEVEKW